MSAEDASPDYTHRSSWTDSTSMAQTIQSKMHLSVLNICRLPHVIISYEIQCWQLFTKGLITVRIISKLQMISNMWRIFIDSMQNYILYKHYILIILCGASSQHLCRLFILWVLELKTVPHRYTGMSASSLLWGYVEWNEWMLYSIALLAFL